MVLKHEVGHHVQYTLNLHGTWEYIARHFEKIRHYIVEQREPTSKKAF